MNVCKYWRHADQVVRPINEHQIRCFMNLLHQWNLALTMAVDIDFERK